MEMATKFNATVSLKRSRVKEAHVNRRRHIAFKQTSGSADGFMLIAAY